MQRDGTVSFIPYRTINAKTRSQRVAEGEAILASIFQTEAVAA